MKKSELKQIIKEEINKVLNEVNLEKYKIGDITPYGETVRSHQIRVTNNGKTISLSTLKFSEAENIANKLNEKGFKAEAFQVKGIYYDGFLSIENPKAHDDLKKIAAIIEDILGHIIVNDDNERIREKGRI
jgi:hypothetical protein